jgi:hypothetical protein
VLQTVTQQFKNKFIKIEIESLNLVDTVDYKCYYYSIKDNLMFFNKKPIYLDCYTTHNHVYDMFKIESAKKFVPEWFRQLPSTFKDHRSVTPIPTVKTCTGIASYFKNSLILPLWTDTQLGYASVSNGYTNNVQPITQFSDQLTTGQIHDQKQIGNDFMPDESYLHFKIFSPWVFECSEDIDWLWTQPTYNFKYPDKIIILPGILEFKYNSNVFINCSIRKLDENKTPTLLKLEAGQPLVHLTPITDKEIIVRNHLVTPEVWNQKFAKNNRVFFFNNHNKKRNFLKNQEDTSKCPFGFKRK